MVVDIHTHVGRDDHLNTHSIGLPYHERDDDAFGSTNPDNPVVDYEQWTDVMDLNGIDEAIIMPSFTYDRRHGSNSTTSFNDSIHRIVDTYPRFSAGIATVEPTHGDEALIELERVRDLGFEAVGWHHEQQGISLDSRASIECYKKADELGLTILVHCFSPHWNFENLDRLAKIAPIVDQPIIVLVSLNMPDNVSKVIELGQRYGHLYFDTALVYPLGLIIERFVDQLGADRLLFGSDYYAQPLLYRKSPCLHQVREANISDDDRALILEDNAKRLFNL